jgi:uncharacterized protein (TIGR02996 family)
VQEWEKGFVRTIMENPHDDGARLVYADRLEEEGQTDYAEFIRLSVDTSAAALASENRERERSLFKEIDVIGLCGIPADQIIGRPVIHPDYLRLFLHPTDPYTEDGRDWQDWLFQWERGFVTRVRAEVAQFLEHGAQVLSVNPVETVTLTVGYQPVCRIQLYPESSGGREGWWITRNGEILPSGETGPTDADWWSSRDRICDPEALREYCSRCLENCGCRLYNGRWLLQPARPQNSRRSADWIEIDDGEPSTYGSPYRRNPDGSFTRYYP